MRSAKISTPKTKFSTAVNWMATMLLMCIAVISAAAQKSGSVNGDAVKNLAVAQTPRKGGELKIVNRVPLSFSNYYKMLAPNAVAADAIYSNITNYSGNSFSNAGATTGTKTLMVADDLTFTGTAPINTSGFTFSIVNANAAQVSVRPSIYFYQADGTGGAPGTLIASYLYNPVTLAANSITTFKSTDAFTLRATTIWAGVAFDNQGSSTATVAQLNNFGQGFYNPINRGSSLDRIFVSTAAATGANSPAGAARSFGGAPVANLGWEINTVASVLGITRLDSDPRPTPGTARWRVRFNMPISGLTASNFSLVSTDNVNGTISSVVPETTAPSQNWTVTVSLRSGAGEIGINLSDTSNLSTGVTNSLPYRGEVYKVYLPPPPTASNASVSGRVAATDGRGIANAVVTMLEPSGAARIALTNPFGYFTFQEVPTGSTYIIGAAHKNYLFDSPSQVFFLSGDYEGVIFYAQPR